MITGSMSHVSDVKLIGTDTIRNIGRGTDTVRNIGRNATVKIKYNKLNINIVELTW